MGRNKKGTQESQNVKGSMNSGVGRKFRTVLRKFHTLLRNAQSSNFFCSSSTLSFLLIYDLQS